MDKQQVNEAKWTKGPWEFDEDDFHVYADGTPVASVYGPDDFPCLDNTDAEDAEMMAEAKATGALIQAAPDLYEALKALVAGNEQANLIRRHLYDDPAVQYDESYLDKARAALEKASRPQ